MCASLIPLQQDHLHNEPSPLTRGCGLRLGGSSESGSGRRFAPPRCEAGPFGEDRDRGLGERGGVGGKTPAQRVFLFLLGCWGKVCTSPPCPFVLTLPCGSACLSGGISSRAAQASYLTFIVFLFLFCGRHFKCFFDRHTHRRAHEHTPVNVPPCFLAEMAPIFPCC